MKKKALFFTVLVTVLGFSSCKLPFLKDLGAYDSYADSLEFKAGKYYVDKDDITVCYVTASPSDSFDYLDVSFSLSDEKVAAVIDTGKTFCMVRGISEGSTILTAKLGNCEAKCVVSVR